MEAHWMREQVTRLHALAGQKEAHQTFVEAVRQVVAEVARRPGVTTSFACHEGLMLDAAGQPARFEALAAMTQACTAAGLDAAEELALGGVQQLVIVGQSHKLALFVVGPVSLGVLSPVAVSLSNVLAGPELSPKGMT